MSITKNIRDAMYYSLEKVVDAYNLAYEKAPRTTNFLSTLAGTLGGDFIAKTSYGQKYTLRDVGFTTFAAVYQSWLYPKFIDFTNYIVEKPFVEKAYKKIGMNKEWAKTLTLVGMFFLPNMLYWEFLSVKNQIPITTKGAEKAAKTIAIGSIPYLGIDYLVANKLKKKYCLPVWSASGIVYSTFLAAVAYMAK